MQTLSCENEFYLHENKKSHFHIISFALSLAMKQRLGVTRKWPIRAVVYYLVLRNLTAPITRKFSLGASSNNSYLFA